MLSLTLLLLLLVPAPALGRKITVTNRCPSTVWPALLTPSDIGSPIPSHPAGWELPSGDSTSFDVAPNWTAGRIWARTGCVNQGGQLRCLTGQCEPKSAGSLECSGGGEAPATLAEFTLAPNGQDNYDISLVDGFNVPMIILPTAPDCPKPDCPVNINAKCPGVLRTGLDQNGANLGCVSSCIRGFGQEKFGNRACCSGGYNDPALCAICGVDFYNVFKVHCPNAYAYAYDEKSGSALFTCPSSSSSDYEIVFCPGGSDYIGPKSASVEYDNDRAACANKVNSGPQQFAVGPSPTQGASIGDIKYTAGAGGGGPAPSAGKSVPPGGTSSAAEDNHNAEAAGRWRRETHGDYDTARRQAATFGDGRCDRAAAAGSGGGSECGEEGLRKAGKARVTQGLRG
ncbi:thaumatin family-domain-containing protein [Dioszegia hungarica]|uniref:Thaumatin family-domain-containing protein n=1 Tax=Dioszegia hungarica TaxID=4972 RepID=A0AA38H7I1_9TREE|nr:thaumatin family-domain-containing protein [Dioszegia hungarica]KAI9634241.1 thaumatin family-domain-containing protein [Dioszegia hungarica]